jgi:phospholipase C
MARSLAVLSLGLSLGAIAAPTSSGMNNIKNVVVLVQENRSFDTLAGGFTYNPDIDGLVNQKYCNPANVSVASSEDVCAAGIAKNIASDDPDHTITGVNMQIFGNYHPKGSSKSTMDGFVTEQSYMYSLQNDMMEAAEVINYYKPDLVPVTNAMAENYVLFDRWFASIPGPTDPNRAYLTSGTSHGHGDNGEVFYNAGMPQKSIFEQLSEKGISWINYENTTNIGAGSFPPDAMFYEWTAKSAKDQILPLDKFYKDAKAGTLPQFSWINPECCDYMSMHPKSPINMGENFMKGIYEAIRSSPQWNETLFILTWDEHGGFADHVAPPTGVPPGDDLTYVEKANDGKNYTFKFDRLGVRVPTLLISPWVEKGVVQNKPGSGENEFTHTSILKFLSELWDLESLTPRVDWSPSFGDLITNKFRDDTPAQLPNAAGYPLQ